MRRLVGGANQPGVVERAGQRQGGPTASATPSPKQAMNSMGAGRRDPVDRGGAPPDRQPRHQGTLDHPSGFDRIVVQAPGESDPASLERVIGQTAQLTFQMVDVENSVQEALAGAVPPDSVLMLDEAGRPPYLVKRRVLVSGENLTKAEVTTDQNGQTAIGFRFDGAGAQRFGEATPANIGKPFAIILDGKVISAPEHQERHHRRLGHHRGPSRSRGLGNGEPAERRRPAGPAEGRGTPYGHRRTGRGRRVGAPCPRSSASASSCCS
jgi:preprotein translocase subunit SecD